jgi:hypothetical protein
LEAEGLGVCGCDLTVLAEISRGKDFNYEKRVTIPVPQKRAGRKRERERERCFLFFPLLFYVGPPAYWMVLPIFRAGLLPFILSKPPSHIHPEVRFTNLLGTSQPNQVDNQD